MTRCIDSHCVQTTWTRPVVPARVSTPRRHVPPPSTTHRNSQGIPATITGQQINCICCPTRTSRFITTRAAVSMTCIHIMLSCRRGTARPSLSANILSNAAFNGERIALTHSSPFDKWGRRHYVFGQSVSLCVRPCVPGRIYAPTGLSSTSSLVRVQFQLAGVHREAEKKEPVFLCASFLILDRNS